MDRLLYVSTVGLANIEQAQAVRANNLANVSTNGFRGDFAQVMSQEVKGDGYQGRVYGVNNAPGVNLAHGSQQQTGRSLDVAINGDGLLTVLLPNGEEGYTRNGNFQIDSTGQLLSSQGMPVMGRGGPVVLPPYESIVFGADGAITVRPQGQGPDALVQVDTLKLVNPDAERVKKDATGMLVDVEGIPFNVDETVMVNPGFLETSNVNAIHELTEILSLARQFELEVRMMKTAETNDEAASQLLRIS